jgi:hypothetical protein
MEPKESFDEVAFNTLLADGLDVPTAYAASIRDPQPAGIEDSKAATYNYRRSIDLGLLAGLVLVVLWLLLT